eukprot:TRINITY_DN27147_c0_g1_i1.p3 TRINITY_DN27147_c0_g1~~TRINITY_DN27147_c0_g1_i1.p3  ORF type:complete len:263 (+),score=56.31 TRINITY_DN27147_c0_g1_i1:98-790(+)
MVATAAAAPGASAAAAEANFDCWETARVDPNAKFDGVRAVFGYGSLIFRPGFAFERAYPASVRGFARRFWQRSCDHRGTVEAPGRVAVLVQSEEVPGAEADALVHGVAYEVAEADWAEVLQQLDIRERHGYVRTVAELQCEGAGADSASPVRAVVYYAHEPRSSAAYAGPEAVPATAEVIARSIGPSGRNDEYLYKLEDALQKWKVPTDDYLVELAKTVRSLQNGTKLDS